MLIGYARASTGEQKMDLQLDALHQAGCERVYTEEASGARSDRPEFARALDHAREGDTIVVWRLDRFGRSLQDLVEKMEDLRDRGVVVRSLTEGIDTTSAGGRLVLHVFGALAEFERELIRERTLAGLRSARARGRKGGRPRAMSEDDLELACRMVKDPGNSVDEVCRAVGVSKSTLYRYVSPTGERRQQS